MRLLLDACVWGRVKRRILVTLDKDFGELAVVRDQPHSGIVRLVGFPAPQQAGACHRVVMSHGDEVLDGGLATVTSTSPFSAATRHAVRVGASGRGR